MVFSGYMPRSGIAGSYDSSVFRVFLDFFFAILYIIIYIQTVSEYIFLDCQRCLCQKIGSKLLHSIPRGPEVGN